MKTLEQRKHELDERAELPFRAGKARADDVRSYIVDNRIHAASVSEPSFDGVVTISRGGNDLKIRFNGKCWVVGKRDASEDEMLDAALNFLEGTAMRVIGP